MSPGLGARLETVEHLDVLVVGAGLSGVAAGLHADRVRVGDLTIFEARHVPRRHVGPLPLPGVRSDSDCSRSASVPAVDRHVHRRRGVDPALHRGHRRRRGHRRPRSASGTAMVAADWSTAEARWHVTAERTDTGDPSCSPAAFLFGCTGYYRYDHGYQPDFPGADGFAGRIVHPQAWPDDLDCADQARGRHRQRGHGGDDRAGPRAGRPHVTMVQRSPSYVLTVPTKTPIARIVLRRRPGALDRAGAQVDVRHDTRASTSSAGADRKWSSGCSARAREAAPAGLRHRHPLHAALRAVGPALCLPDGDLFRAIGRGGRRRHRPHRHLHRAGHPPGVGPHSMPTHRHATGLELQFAGGHLSSASTAPTSTCRRG